jgi:hypothetical protein
VAEDHHPVAEPEVEVLVAVDVPDARPLAALEQDRVRELVPHASAVAGRDERLRPLEQLERARRPLAVPALLGGVDGDPLGRRGAGRCRAHRVGSYGNGRRAVHRHRPRLRRHARPRRSGRRLGRQVRPRPLAGLDEGRVQHVCEGRRPPGRVCDARGDGPGRAGVSHRGDRAARRARPLRRVARGPRRRRPRPPRPVRRHRLRRRAGAPRAGGRAGGAGGGVRRRPRRRRPLPRDLLGHGGGPRPRRPDRRRAGGLRDARARLCPAAGSSRWNHLHRHQPRLRRDDRAPPRRARVGRPLRRRPVDPVRVRLLEHVRRRRRRTHGLRDARRSLQRLADDAHRADPAPRRPQPLRPVARRTRRRRPRPPSAPRRRRLRRRRRAAAQPRPPPAHGRRIRRSGRLDCEVRRDLLRHRGRARPDRRDRGAQPGFSMPDPVGKYPS